MATIMKKYSVISDKLKKGYQGAINPGYYTLKHPGVPIAGFYSMVVPTESGIVVDQDPRIWTSKDQFCPNPKITIGSGDSDVNSASAATPLIKWAWEYENFKSTDPTVKPVKIVQVCSERNRRGTPYDKKDSKGVNILNKSETQGVECTCSEGKVNECSHAAILHQPKILEYIGTAAQTNQRSTLIPEIARMADAEVEALVENCDIFYNSLNGLLKEEGTSDFGKGRNSKVIEE